MSQYLHHGVVGAVVLVLAGLILIAPAPTHGQAAAEDAKAAALKERNRLWEETQKLRAGGKTTEAIAAAEAMLAIERKVLPEEYVGLADMLGWLAMLHVEREDFAAARAAWREALVILRKRLGESDWRVVDARRALEDVERLTGMDRAQRARLAEVERLNRTVLDLCGAGKYAEAVPLARQALAIRKAALGERHPDTATSLNNLAFLLASQEDYAAAKPLLEQALAINKAVLGERHPTTATSLNNLAALLWTQGDHAAARPLYEQALALRKAVLGERHPDTAASLNNLAMLLQAQGDYAAAKPLLEQALALCKAVLGERHPTTATSLNNLAFLLEAQGDYAAAKPLFEQAMDSFRHNLDLAAAAQTERQQMAMADMLRFHLNAFLSAAPRVGIGDEVSYRQVLAWKGAILERQRRLRDLRRLLRADPRPEVARAAADWQSTVVRLATLALAQPGPNQQDAWRRQLADLTERKDQLEEELTRRSTVFSAARAEARRTPEQLQAALPRDAALIDVLEYTHSSPPLERKGKMKFEGRLVAFVVRPDRPIARVELGPLAPIRTAIDAWRPILRREKPAPQDEPGGPAARLRRLVWSPLEEHLAGVATVLVSPDGALGLVPLGALPGQVAGSYLIEDYALALVPVPRLFGAGGAVAADGPKPALARAEMPSLLLVGDVDYGGDPGAGADRGMSRSAAVSSRAGLLPDFPKLPATGDEIASIGRDFKLHFQGAQPDKLFGDLATEAALREAASKHRFLHLATHGYFAPEALKSALGRTPGAGRPGELFGGLSMSGYHPGLLSGLVLTGANVRPTPLGKDDGILTALEVAELDLSGVALAVLSACETGLGAVAGGEGLLGLQRAFQVAGAQSVVASLWTVGDEPTRALMARFYENLWRHGLPARAALRQAQLQMLREGYRREGYPRGVVPLPADAPRPERVPPFYWAAFVLSTDRL